MQPRKFSPQTLQEIRDLAAGWGRIVARRAFGASGPGTDVDLDMMEQIADAAVAGLTAGTLDTLLEQQAHLLGVEQACPECGRLCPVRREERTLTVRGGPLTPSEPICHCPACRRDFSPQRPLLRLDGHSYSPAVLRLILEAAGRLPSFANAAFAVSLAGVHINARQVGRLTHEIGGEMAQQRDAKAVQHRRRELPARVAAPPPVAAVEVDGGRLRTRATGSGPGVHEPQYKEDKTACLVSLRSERHEHDPQPEPPASFVEPRRVQRLVRQMKGLPGDHPQEEAEPAEPSEAEQKAPPVRQLPQRLVRTCVASRQDSRSFGPLVAAEAQEHDSTSRYSSRSWICCTFCATCIWRLGRREAKKSSVGLCT